MLSQKHDILNKTNFWSFFAKRTINFEPGKGKEIMKIQYKGFMRERIRRNPVTIGPDASFFKARDYIHVMGIRHLPVVDKNNRLVGIVMDQDI